MTEKATEFTIAGRVGAKKMADKCLRVSIGVDKIIDNDDQDSVHTDWYTVIFAMPWMIEKAEANRVGDIVRVHGLAASATTKDEDGVDVPVWKLWGIDIDVLARPNEEIDGTSNRFSLRTENTPALVSTAVH